MQHLEKYFSREGTLSSSAANQLAEKVKEKNRVLETQLESALPYNVYVTIEGTTYNTARSERVEFIGLIKEIGENYSLSAWLREAIKARTALLDYYRTCNHTVFGALPEPFQATRPTIANILPPTPATKEDALATLNAEQLAEYFYYESIAARIGKNIHGEGKLPLFVNQLTSTKSA